MLLFDPIILKENFFAALHGKYLFHLDLEFLWVPSFRPRLMISV